MHTVAKACESRSIAIARAVLLGLLYVTATRGEEPKTPSRLILQDNAAGTYDSGRRNASAKWRKFFELALLADLAKTNDSESKRESADSYSTWPRALSVGMLVRRDLSNSRHINIDASLAGERTDGSDETARTNRFSAQVAWDIDVFRSDSPRLGRIALGGRYEHTWVDYEDRDFGNGGRSELAVMFVERKEEDRACTRGATILTLGRGSFDDELNPGDPAYDQSDEGDQWYTGFEQSWTFGELPGYCVATGPFQRELYDQRTHLWGGWLHQRQATEGTLFSGSHDVLYFAGQTPLFGDDRLGLLWNVSYTRSDYSKRETESAWTAQLTGRWRIAEAEDMDDVLRSIHVRAGVAYDYRNSSFDAFDYDRWTVFAGLSIDLGGLRPDGGPITGGSSTIDRRRPSGSSTPKTPR